MVKLKLYLHLHFVVCRERVVVYFEAEVDYLHSDKELAAPFAFGMVCGFLLTAEDAKPHNMHHHLGESSGFF